MVATLATSVSTLQSALSGIVLSLTTAMDERAATAASALATGLSNVESNLTTAIGTQGDAPSLADIENTVSAALDDKVGIPEHLDEETQKLVIPATKLYAETKEIKQTFRKTIGVLRSVVTPIMLTLVEELAKDNPIPFVWHEAMLQAMLGDVVDRAEEVGLLQARAAWVRREAGAVPIEANNTMAMMYGVTHKGNALVLMYQSYVYTSKEQEHFEMICQVMSDTNPTSIGRTGQVDTNTAGHFAQMHERFLEALKEVERITEMTLVTYGKNTYYSAGVPTPGYIQAIPNPFDPGTDEYTRYESSRCPCFPSLLLRAAALWPENISAHFYGSLIAIHYLSPGATSLFPPCSLLTSSTNTGRAIHKLGIKTESCC
jgi:hypothetical protein